MEERKRTQVTVYTKIAEYLSKSANLSGFAQAYCYLNFGYEPNENKQYARVTLPKYLLNKQSVNLTLEVIGDTDLSGRRVLEIGSGRGGNILTMKEYFNPLLVVGVDLCEASVRFCKNTHQLPNLFFSVGDAENVPFAEGFFDVVFNLESSHAYPNRNKFYHEVHRVLKPDGCFLYSDILAVEEFIIAQHYCEDLGFQLTRNQDISSNVIMSCDKIAESRRDAFHAIESKKELQFVDYILAVPGSYHYECLKKKIAEYRILKFVK